MINDEIINKIKGVWTDYIKNEEDKDDKKFRESNFHIQYFDKHKLIECVDIALQKDDKGNLYTLL